MQVNLVFSKITNLNEMPQNINFTKINFLQKQFQFHKSK